MVLSFIRFLCCVRHCKIGMRSHGFIDLNHQVVVFPGESLPIFHSHFAVFEEQSPGFHDVCDTSHDGEHESRKGFVDDAAIGHQIDGCTSECKVLNDITNFESQHFSASRISMVAGAPLSRLAVLSSQPTSANHFIGPYALSQEVGKENIDTVSLVQTSRPSILSLKNAPPDLQQAYRWQSLQDGQGYPESDDENGNQHEEDESGGYSPSDGPAPSNVQPPSSDESRQDVILFHLQDPTDTSIDQLE